MNDERVAPRRIGLLGGECTGKSTLAGALATVLPACVAPEVARAFVERHARPPRADEQGGVLADQAAAVARTGERCPHHVVVADPAPLMTAVYSVLYFGDDSLVPTGVDDALDYDLLVWSAPDLPWQADAGMRDGPEYREAADRILSGLVEDVLSPRGADVVRVTGDLESRVRAVQAALTGGSGRAWHRQSRWAAT